MPSLHMPLQSGSDRVLQGDAPLLPREKFLGILDEVRAAIPDAAITTDIIVGFPGETEEDFQDTLRVVAAGSRFAAAFTFQYSIRPGTPAATMADQVPKPSSRSATTGSSTCRTRSPGRRTASFEGRRSRSSFAARGEGRKDADNHSSTSR
jgi:tRNA-2-methylthio-N6-dimethylallyladenosine synthase